MQTEYQIESTEQPSRPSPQSLGIREAAEALGRSPAEFRRTIDRRKNDATPYFSM
jgi:hypothetical protein